MVWESRMKKGPLIGTGRTAEIYAWGDDRILKLFMDWCPHSWIEREERLSRIVYEAGVPVPAVEGIIEVDGRSGIIFERITGRSMPDLIMDEMASSPDGVPRYGEILAELHTSIHSLQIPDLPSLRDMIEHGIRNAKALSEGSRLRTLQILDQMQDGTILCHYDFHPYNIIMSPRGPIIIDWMNASQGNPYADIARTLLISQGFQHSIPTNLQSALNSFIDRYLTRYSELREISLEEVRAWRLPIVAARMNEEIPYEKEWLLSIVSEELTRRSHS
jgi:uncharacterized protein (TIGR02172 family)